MSNYILPVIVLVIVMYGVYKKIDVYDVFIEGAKDSVKLVINMFPCILAMIFAVNIFLNSGLLEIFSNSKILSIILMRPISANASLSILNDIFKIKNLVSESRNLHAHIEVGINGNIASTVEAIKDMIRGVGGDIVSIEIQKKI